MTEVSKFYEKIEAQANADIAQLGRLSRIVSWLRVVLFVATVVVAYILWPNVMCVAMCVAAGTVLFLIVARYHDVLLRQTAMHESRRDYARARLRVMAGDLSHQPQGNEHIDAMHSFTFDLDVFGRSSLYSMLDSTATPVGAHILADWLKNPLQEADMIVDRQKAITELAQLNDLRVQFHAMAKTIEKQVTVADFSKIPSFALPWYYKIAAFVALPVFVTMVAMVVMEVVPGMWLLWLVLTYLAIAASLSKRVSLLHEWLCSTVDSLATRCALFEQIENARFLSPMLCRLQQNFCHGDNHASQLIARLSRHLKSLDQRYNAVGYVLFNGTMLWDLLVLGNIDRWMNRYGQRLELWQNTLGEVDALCALATYAYENPEYVYPHIDSQSQVAMRAEQMGHPLLNKQKRVDNPLPQMSQGQFLIITGANMAGKSTYLRTIGVNFLLAMIGAPVAARDMEFTPMKLFTGLRTSDSLADGESYFFAELKRLQAVVQEAGQGRPMFILLDEILRGTNSADKQRGSLALVRRLVNLPVAGALATHDLVLGSLADEFPNQVSAYCFEAKIEGDTLSFDYALQPGIAHNLNAYFLMEKMGIV